MSDILLDTIIDSAKLLPFLFLTYLLMECLEHKAGERARRRIQSAGRFGPVWGGLLGLAPQCGFSAAASSLYAGRVITVGTLLSVYLSTSDEMLPILISEAAPVGTIAKILAVKAAVAIVSGLAAEAFYVHVRGRGEGEMDIHAICEVGKCHCEEGIFRSAGKHTAQIFLYIFLLSLLLNAVIGFIGEESLAGLISGIPLAGVLLAALVGLIPNCAPSVVITELYLDGIIGAGAMMSGLLANAGTGLLVLFRVNRDRKQSIGIAAALYAIGVFWGLALELSGIAF